MQRGVLQLLQRPDAKTLDGLVRSLWDSLGHALALPFDLLRLQHAAGVLAGAWPRSLLESTRFEQQLGAMERLALGPLARGDEARPKGSGSAPVGQAVPPLRWMRGVP